MDAAGLLAECQARHRAGASFDEIWRGVLQAHPLTEARWVAPAWGDAATRVPLREGGALVFDPRAGWTLSR